MKKKLTFVALCVGLLAPVVSWGAVLDFGTGTAGVGGTIVDLGLGDGKGFGIFIDNLTVSGTAFDGVYNVDGALACATGGGASCGALSFDTVAGTVSIVGSIPALGIASTNLVLGSISSFSFGADAGAAVFFAMGTDTKDAGLLASLGINPVTPFSFVGFSLGFGPTVDCGQGGPCYSAISTDFLNTSGVVGEAVPEPATLVLLGSGLIGLARARRRNT